MERFMPVDTLRSISHVHLLAAIVCLATACGDYLGRGPLWQWLFAAGVALAGLLMFPLAQRWSHRSQRDLTVIGALAVACAITFNLREPGGRVAPLDAL